MTPPDPRDSGAAPSVVVSTDPDVGDFTADDPAEDAAVVQRAYDEAVAQASEEPIDPGDDVPEPDGAPDPVFTGATGGTLVLDPGDRPFVFDAPLDIWQSGCRVTATGGPTIVPAEGYEGPLLTSGLRDTTVAGEDGMIANLAIEGLWLDGLGRATGVMLNDVQLSTVSKLHVRNTDGPGLWLADACIENLFSDIVLGDHCGSQREPALLIRPVSEERPDAPTEGYDGIGNLTLNSTHFSGVLVHFPGNQALRVSSGPTPVSKGRRHRKFQFTGCLFHGHSRGTDPLVTLEDVRQAAFVGTQWLLWREDGVVVQFGTEDARWPVANTTFSHCRFVAKPDSEAIGIRCRNVEPGVTSLQAVGNSFERLAHAVDWGDQPDKRAAWAANGVDVEGEAHLGTLPEDADEPPFR